MKRVRSVLVFWVFIFSATLGGLSFGQSETPEYIVTLKDNQSIERFNKSHHTRTVRRSGDSHVFLTRPERDGNAPTLKELQNDRTVDSVEVNARFRMNWDRTQATVTGLSTDTVYLLDGRGSTDFYGAAVPELYARQPALALIRADQVRSITTGTGAKVAYIDTGVDPDHPALSPWLDPGIDLINGRSVSEYDGLSTDTVYLLDTDSMFLLDTDSMFLLDTDSVYLLDDRFSSGLPQTASAESRFPPAFGHGTLVAGVIHAVAPTARIVPIKAFDAYGYTTVFDVVNGVYAAINLQVDALNMSFSSNQNSEALARAIRNAQANGIAVVAAAGNGGRDVRDSYPAALPSVYGVAATDLNDRLASYSNYGSLVSLAAPGSWVVTTAPGGRYAVAFGTSFSAPMVSATMALRAALLDRGHSAGPVVVNTTDPIGLNNTGFARLFGTGRLNVRQALTR